MIIENLPALQQWLTKVLKPLCDADPEALTKYVIALLKKDVPEEELRVSMVEQLDIFLQSGTIPFVTRLFETIQSREYETVEVERSEESSAGAEANYNISTDETRNQHTTASTVSIDRCVAGSVSMEAELVETKDLTRCAEPDTSGDHLSRDCIGNQSSSDSNNASDDNRSETKSGKLLMEKRRHWRDKRSRSTSSELSPIGKRKCGQGVSKWNANSSGRHRWSPIKRRIRRDIHKRRKSRSPFRFRGSQVAKMHSRSISDRSRSRSGSPFRRKRTSSGDGKFRRNPPSPESNSLLDNITNKCSVKSVVVKPDAGSKHDINEANSSGKSRCIDFDEKGVCLRGELCPYDHGSDPVVLKDIANNESAGLSVPPNFTGKIESEKPMNFLNTIAPVRPPVPNDEYFPESPSIVPQPQPMMPPFGWGMPRRPIRPRHLGMDPFMGRGGMMRPPMMRQLGPPQFHGQRQLIPIPVEGMQQHHGVQQAMPLLPENPFAVAGARMVCRALFGMRGRGRGTFDHGRLGPRLIKPNGNCCLEVRKIPRESNNIESLINHFSRFGNVVSIQIGFDSDPEGALVIFSSHSDALQAYRSTDAVLNNRFVKVYWHNKEQAVNNQDVHSIKSTDGNMVVFNNKVMEENAQSSLGQVPAPNCNVEQDQTNGTDTVSDNQHKIQEVDEKSLLPTSMATSTNPDMLQTEPTDTKLSKKMNAAASDSQRKHDMMVLLNAQIQEQKSLIQKLEVERNRMTQKQRDEVMQIIKNLQASCETLKANIESNCTSCASEKVHESSSSNDGKSSCSKEEIRRKILDAELALYMLGKKGQDTIDLEKEILQLRNEEMLLSVRK